MIGVVEKGKGHLTGRIHRQEIRGPGLAGDHARFHPFVREAEVIGGPLHLQAVARDRVSKDSHGAPKVAEIAGYR